MTIHDYVTFASLASILVMSSASLGCSPGAEDASEIARASLTNTIQAARSVGVAWVVLGGIDDASARSDRLACEAVASAATRGVVPESCVQKRCDGSVLKVELDGCSTPFDRTTLTGKLTAAFSRGQGPSIRVEVFDDGDLHTEGGALSLVAGGEIDFEGGVKRAAWSARWATTAVHGMALDQTSSLEIGERQDRSCVALSGSTQGVVGELEIDTEIKDLVVCAGQLPSRGAIEVIHEGRRRQHTLDISFNGRSSAHVVGEGRSFDLGL